MTETTHPKDAGFVLVQKPDELHFVYTNWRGETAVRRVFPQRIEFRFGSTEWHSEPQWLMSAHDIDKDAYRDFAWNDIRFAPLPEGDPKREVSGSVRVRPLEWDHRETISTAEHAFGRYNVFEHGSYMPGRWTADCEIGRDFPSREAAIAAIEASHEERSLENVEAGTLSHTDKPLVGDGALREAAERALYAFECRLKGLAIGGSTTERIDDLRAALAQSSPSPAGEPVATVKVTDLIKWRDEWRRVYNPEGLIDRSSPFDLHIFLAEEPTPQPDADRETVERLTRKAASALYLHDAAEARAEAAETALAAAQETIGRKDEALKPFAFVAEADIGVDEADNDDFRPMGDKYRRGPRITVGHFRHARSALQSIETAPDAVQAGREERLHPDTANLVNRFALALATKLVAAQDKYGHTNGWKTDDWQAECKSELMEHVHKGDPLDVAAYSAFCWARGWSTKPIFPEHDTAFLPLFERWADNMMIGQDDRDILRREVRAALQSSETATGEKGGGE